MSIEARMTNNQSGRPLARSSDFGFYHCHGKPRALQEDSRNSPISGRVRVAVSNGKTIPLTLTLSHGEREQPAAGSLVREVRRADTALGCAESQRRILPLPEGEGRGEGEGDARGANRVGTSPEVCGSSEGQYGFEPFILSCPRLCRRALTLSGFDLQGQRPSRMSPHRVPLPFRRGEGARRAGEGSVLLPERRRFLAVAAIGRRDDHATNDMISCGHRDRLEALSYFGHWPSTIPRG